MNFQRENTPLQVHNEQFCGVEIVVRFFLLSLAVRNAGNIITRSEQRNRTPGSREAGKIINPKTCLIFLFNTNNSTGYGKGKVFFSLAIPCVHPYKMHIFR